MKKIVLYLFMSLLSIVSVGAANEGFSIKIKLNGLKNTKIIIGHYYLEKVLVNDTLMLDNSGVASYKGNVALTQGLYVVSLNKSSYFDFMVGKQQNFEIETDTTDFLNHAKFKNSDENKAFFEYQKLLEKNRNLVQNLQKERSKSTDSKRNQEINEQLAQINKETLQFRDKLIKDYKDSFLSIFLKSTMDTEIPEKLRQASNDAQYYYYREHFFDNTDFNDARILNSPVLMQRFNRYFERIVPQIPDTLNTEIDRIVAKATNKDIFQAVVSQLHLHYNQSQIMGFDKVFVHVSEKYYLTGQAFWVSEDYVNKLRDKIRRMKPCLIGSTAKELKMRVLPTDSAKMKTLKVTLELIRKEGIELAKDSSLSNEIKLTKYIGLFNGYTEQLEEFASLHQVEADFTLLWFWEPSCNHCQKATPKLKPLYDKYKSKGVDIFAVCITNAAFMEGADFFKATEKNWNRYIDDVASWYTFVQTNHLNCFTNVFDPYHYTQFREYYDISATPSVFILDKNKKIVAKQISVEQVDEILDDLIKNK